MLRLTLRTLLAYIDDTLEPAQARELGEKIAASDYARELIEKIKRVTRRRGLKTPVPAGKDDTVSDANTVAEYLSDTLDADGIAELEATCLKSDVHLAEVAACHQILTLVLTEPVRVPPRANQRMYKLVEPPASIPNRKPGKTVPVGGMPAQSGDTAEHDFRDAALLLGMKRYSPNQPRGTRLRLVAAVAALAALLVVAVLMALPRGEPTAPTRETAARTPPAVPPTDPPKQDDPKPPAPVEPQQPEWVAPPPRLRPDPVGDVAVKPDDKPAAKPDDKPAGKQDPVLNADVPDPLPLRERIGRVVTPNVIVVTREPNSQSWVRAAPDGEPAVLTTDTVLCLPGYKADVQLDSDVIVHLWGNIPSLLPDPAQPGDRLRADVRVRFHTPSKGFDADVTLLAGRIYVATRKPGGARVRVRVASEVWDVTLPDEKTDVMVDSVTGFVPGTTTTEGKGEAPRTDVRAVVVRGSAGIRAPRRPKDFPAVAAPAIVRWDSKSGRLSDPEPVKPEEMPRYAKFSLIDAKEGAGLQALLTEMSAALKDKDGLKAMLTERLTEPPIRLREDLVRFAMLAQAATLTVDPDPNGVRLLADRLREQTRDFIRLWSIPALSYWSAQAPGNAELLYRQLVDNAGFTGEEADLILRLLRGYVPPGRAGADDLDALVGLLSNGSVAIRELALWNLIGFVDPGAVTQKGLTIRVAETDRPEYERFLKQWRARVEELKKGPMPPKK